MQKLVSDGARKFLVKIEFSTEKRQSGGFARRSLGEPVRKGGTKWFCDLPFNRNGNQFIACACKSPDVILGWSRAAYQRNLMFWQS